MVHIIARQPCGSHEEEGMMPLTGCEDIAMISSEEPVGMTGPLRSSFSAETTTSPATDDVLQGDHVSDEHETGTMIATRGFRMGKQLDVRMWEVIEKEIMDCHEPTQLYRLRGRSKRLLSTENPSPLAALNGINCPDRFQAMITMIAVQLLATCFTLPPESERYSRPPASYRHRSFPSGSSSDPRLISSLRLHTHFRNSPALGHHARNSSPTLAWPGGRSGPSREERLAEDISRQRRLHKLGESQRLGKGVNSRRAWSKASSGEIERESGIVVTSTSLRRRSRSSNEMTTSHSAPCQRRKVDRLYGRPRRFDSPPAAMPSQTSGTQRARPIWRKSRLNGTGSHRWSFQPILRSEDHPVFIQPVKDHIIKRWRARRPYPRSVTSTARLDNRFTEPPRKQTRTSDISTTDLSLTTSGPSTESLISNAAPVRSSAPSPEAVKLDLTAGAETHIRSNPFPAPSEPLGAHSRGTIMSPQPSSLLPSDPFPTLVDDDAPSYLPRNGTACRTPSRTDREHGEDGRALVQYRDLSALRTHRHTGISAVGKVAEWKH